MAFPIPPIPLPRIACLGFVVGFVLGFVGFGLCQTGGICQILDGGLRSGVG